MPIMSTCLYYFMFVIAAFIDCNVLPTTSSLPSCEVKNLDVNECLKTYLQNVVKYAKHDNPKYGLPLLDPYHIPKILIPPFSNDGISVDLRNSSIYGLSKAKFTKIQSDPVNGFFDIQYTTPATSFVGDYNITGKLFSMPINGKGKYETNLINLYHAIKIKGDVKKNSNGKKYLDVKTVSVHLKPQTIKVRFDQLFKNNKELGEIVNQMMNDNWQEMFGKFRPKMEEEMSKHVFKVASEFFKLTPYNDMFRDL